MIVIFDTNIWMGELYLRSPAASAIRLYLRRTGATIGLPEVIEREVEYHLRDDITSATSRLVDSHRKLLAYFGTMKEVVAPTEAEIDQVARSTFDSLGVAVRRVPFTFEAARASFDKIVRHEPPSASNNQFKDGVIWADALGLAAEDEVVLITKDKAFFEGQRLGGPLAANLAKEAETAAHPIRLMSEIGGLLDTIRVDLPLDSDSLFQQYLASPISATFAAAFSDGFIIDGTWQVTTRLFATESPDRVFIEFEFTVPLRDESGRDRRDAVMRGSGTALLDSDTEVLHEMQSTGSQHSYLDPVTGEVINTSVVVGAGHVFLGHREVPYRLRVPLNNSAA